MKDFAERRFEKLRRCLRQGLNHPVTDHGIFVLILLSVALLFMEILTPAPEVELAGKGILVLFLVELTLRFLVARSKQGFFGTYWPDLLSLLPLIFPQVNFLRALRLLRLFRLGPLMRRSNPRLGSLFRRTMGEQLTILAIILVVIVGVTLGLVDPSAKNEFGSLEETLWWSLLSMVAGEPIGAMPEGESGRFFTLLIMLGGLTVFALFTGTVSAVLTERLRMGMISNPESLGEVEDHLLVCGWNRSSRKLLEEMFAGCDRPGFSVVMVAETRPELGKALEEDPRLFFIEGDYTKVEVLRAAKVEEARSAILLADRSIPNRSDQDRDARTILAALMIEKLRPGIFTCAELLSRDNEVHLRMAGIEEVVVGDDYSATILATSSRIRGVTEIADEVFSSKYGNQIFKKAIRPEWCGQTFLQLQQRMKMTYDALLIAVEQSTVADGEPANNGDAAPYVRTVTNPPADYEFQEGDLLILVAKTEPNW